MCFDVPEASENRGGLTDRENGAQIKVITGGSPQKSIQ